MFEISTPEVASSYLVGKIEYLSILNTVWSLWMEVQQALSARTKAEIISFVSCL